MGLQLVTQPKGGIAWSKNPSKLSFIKRGIITTPGSYAQYVLVILDSDRPAFGNTLVLSWAGVSITFTFSSADPTDPTQLTLWSGSLSTCAVQLVADLNRNSILSQSFSITLVSTAGSKATILIKALNKGTGYSLTVAHTGSYIDSSSALTAGVDELVPDDYVLNMAVEMTVNKLVEPMTSGQIYLTAVAMPDMDNNMMQLDFYDLKEIGRTLLQALLPFNAFSPYLMPMAIAYAKLWLTEYYNGSLRKALIDQYGDINGYMPLRILNGGIALSNYPAEVDEFSVGSSPSTFLTAQPRKKLVDHAQPEWLSIYLTATLGSSDDWNVLYTVYYSDGTTGTKSDAVTNQSVLDSIYTIPAGWDQCNLGTIDASKVASYYTVQIVSQHHGDPLSEVFTYAIDTRFFRQVRYFILLNSLGGWDTIRTTGNNDLSAKYIRTTNARAQDIDIRASDGTIQMSVNEEEQTWTMRSGWLLSRAEAEYYRQLLLSLYVAEIKVPLIPNSGSVVFKQPFRSVIVQPTSLNFYEDTDFKWSVEWKMNYANSEINYSQLAPAAEPYFDSFVEFTVATSVGYISLSSTADNIQYTVNGEIVTLSGSHLLLPGLNEYHIVISALNLSYLRINTPGGFHNITVTRIASSTLTTLTVLGFLQVRADYMIKRLLSLYNISTLIIDTTDFTFSADDVLIAALKLYQGGTCNLSLISLPASTPSALGYAAKASLTAAGITVITL